MKLKIDEVVADVTKKEQDLNAKIDEKFVDLSNSLEKEADERNRMMQDVQGKMRSMVV